MIWTKRIIFALVTLGDYREIQVGDTVINIEEVVPLTSEAIFQVFSFDSDTSVSVISFSLLDS